MLRSLESRSGLSQNPGLAPQDANLLLEIFSPAITVTPIAPRCFFPEENIDLWAADASHRAKNLAQMCYSLTSPSVRQAFGLADPGVRLAIDALADAYAHLSEPGSEAEVLPCTPILELIVASLVRLFSGGRVIHLAMTLEPVFLAPIQRRALTLIASELVINALKYAFPASDTGLIELRLIQENNGLRMCVIDNGVGLPMRMVPGSGSALVVKLAALLDAELEVRSAAAGRTGTVCELRSVSLPD